MEQTGSNPNSVEKALSILLAFQTERPSWGVRELSAHLGFSPATVQRILQTLKSRAFVDQDETTRLYRLGTVYYKFLHTLQSTYPIMRVAPPFMERLRSRTQETVHLNAIEGLERVCVDTMESPKNLKASMPIGSRSPLYAGASSKCLLAFSTPEFIENYLKRVKLTPVTNTTTRSKARLRLELAQIRKQGYAESLGERSQGLGSMSAPILDHRGRILATVSLAIPEIRYRDDAHREFCLKELLSTAKSISNMIGHHYTG
jgi:DNA-binding IclR family transcriptional regulator